MYVERKNPTLYTAVKDSNAYFYAGMTKDIKTVFNSMNVAYTDSVAQNTWSNVYAADYKPVIKASDVHQQVMPNVRGMGLKDAVYLLENMGVKISAKGKGKIIAQSVAPGTVLAKGITVMLELS
jgi:cell division protein FtsI (penicillin-binding protein 3)